MGVLIGPSLLSWIKPNAVISALADLGVLFLLFRVGLDVKTRELMRVGPVANLVALLGVPAPFSWVGHYGPVAHAAHRVALRGSGNGGDQRGHLRPRCSRQKGLLRNRASQAILAAAVIDDVLGLIVLAIVSRLARDRVHVLDIVITAVLAIGSPWPWRSGAPPWWA